MAPILLQTNTQIPHITNKKETKSRTMNQQHLICNRSMPASDISNFVI